MSEIDEIPKGEPRQRSKDKTKGSSTPILDNFSRDLTMLASLGELDEVNYIKLRDDCVKSTIHIALWSRNDKKLKFPYTTLQYLAKFKDNDLKNSIAATATEKITNDVTEVVISIDSDNINERHYNYTINDN